MNAKSEMMTEEQWRLREEWRDRRDENDLQSAIRLRNMAIWTAFNLCQGEIREKN